MTVVYQRRVNMKVHLAYYCYSVSQQSTYFIANILVFVSLIVCIATTQLSHRGVDIDIGNKISAQLFNKTLGLSGDLPSVWKALLHFFQLFHVNLLYTQMFCLKILKEEHSQLYKKRRGLFQGMGKEGLNLPVEAWRRRAE